MINKDISYTDFKAYLLSKKLFSWESLSAEDKKNLAYLYYKDHVHGFDVYDALTECSDPEDFKLSIISMIFDESNKGCESLLKRSVMNLYSREIEEDFEKDADDAISNLQDVFLHRKELSNLVIDL